jgi:hypothetical protein
MPTITKTKTTEATRAANTKRAQELFTAGQRIAKGESPTRKESLLVQPAAALKPFFFGSQEVIADAVAEMITTGSTEENLTLVIQGGDRSRLETAFRTRRQRRTHVRGSRSF